MTTGSLPALGVALAILSAASLALGNLWQGRGVERVSARAHGPSSVKQLLRSRVWLAGTALFGVAILLQMGSLVFAPLILVQPIGVTALVFTTLLTARASGHRPSRGVIRAILICLSGVTAYVIVASFVSKQKPIHDKQLVEIISALGAILVISLIVRVLAHGKHRAPILYIIMGGVYSGFVATLGKTVISRVETMFTGGHFTFGSGGWLTVTCLIGIGVASLISMYYVQYSHTCNPPEMVVAGLTVVDPGVAVVLGIVILNEAAGAPSWSMLLFLIAGATAVIGILALEKAERPRSETQPTPAPVTESSAA